MMLWELSLPIKYPLKVTMMLFYHVPSIVIEVFFKRIKFKFFILKISRNYLASLSIEKANLNPTKE
jgi:hypothetical protein